MADDLILKLGLDTSDVKKEIKKITKSSDFPEVKSPYKNINIDVDKLSEKQTRLKTKFDVSARAVEAQKEKIDQLKVSLDLMNKKQEAAAQSADMLRAKNQELVEAEQIQKGLIS